VSPDRMTQSTHRASYRFGHLILLLFSSIMDEDSLYDEFGNYCGPELDDDDDDDDDDDFGGGRDGFPEDEEDGRAGNYYDGRLVERMEGGMDSAADESRIILHEDKKYYPDAEEVYPGVRVVTMDEDAQDITEPIIKPIKAKAMSIQERSIPGLTYSIDFMTTLMQNPRLVRNIAILGNFHHGKTVFVDTLVQATHETAWDPMKEVRYTDLRKDEQTRQLSIKATPVSLVMESISSKSFVMHVVDCPGHVNFSDESTAALRIADGAVIVVDAVEGVMMTTERLIKHAIANRTSIVVVVNKMDRLILELKLPPQDAYFKIMHTLEEINGIIADNTPKDERPTRLSPELGNVCFAAGQHRWSFTLLSFATMYAEKHPSVDPSDFAKRLWGDWYFDENHRVIFSSNSVKCQSLVIFSIFHFSASQKAGLIVLRCALLSSSYWSRYIRYTLSLLVRIPRRL
jgi:116 kDa U5 small nuclear ribonucleoprotein component